MTASTTIRIEILYFNGCPGHEQLVARLPDLLERHDITGEIVQHEVPDDEHARREQFLGSPTVRVNGKDVDPGAVNRNDYGIKCRIYQTSAGLAGLPPDDWILAAVESAPMTDAQTHDA